MKSTQSNNNQHWAADTLLDDMHPMTNLYSQRTQEHLSSHAGATGNARRCINQRTQVRYTPHDRLRPPCLPSFDVLCGVCGECVGTTK